MEGEGCENMDLQEQARIIALARLCGSTLTDKEILDKYSQYYQDALKSITADSKPAKVEVFKRPF